MKAIAESKTITPSVATGARLAGQCLGYKITLDVSYNNNAENSIMLQQLALVDKDKLGKKIRIVVFSKDFIHPGHGAALNPTVAEAQTIVGDVEISVYSLFTNCNVGLAGQLGMLCAGNTERKVYIALVANEAITIATVDPLSLTAHYYID